MEHSTAQSIQYLKTHPTQKPFQPNNRSQKGGHRAVEDFLLYFPIPLYSRNIQIVCFLFFKHSILAFISSSVIYY